MLHKNTFRISRKRIFLSGFFALVLFLSPSISNAITSTSLSTAYKSYVTRAIILPTPPATTDILSTLRALLSQKEYIDLLRGPAGPQGPAGITTSGSSMYSGQPVASIQPSSPAPIPAVFAPVGISQPDPNHNYSGGSYFSATNLSSSELTTTNLHVSGNTTIVGSLNVTGPINGSLSTSNNLTGPITSIGNATSVASQTGTGSTFVMQTSPTLITPNLGVATATSITGTGGTSTATARVAGLNADYLDGFDSNAFGSATVENQTIIINAIGTNGDAANPPSSASSVFGALKYMNNNAAALNIQEFTTVGANTWTKPSGWTTALCEVTIVGGGGGGGGGGGSSSNQGVGGTGGKGSAGGGAEYKRIRLSLTANQTVTIGAAGTKGTGGAAGNNAGTDGTAGGTTSFGSLVVAVGGDFGRGGPGYINTTPHTGAIGASIVGQFITQTSLVTQSDATTWTLTQYIYETEAGYAGPGSAGSAGTGGGATGTGASFRTYPGWPAAGVNDAGTGGSSSYFGSGGDGAVDPGGGEHNGPAAPAAPSGSYGAGGGSGGGGFQFGSSSRAGGNGSDGVKGYANAVCTKVN